MDSTLGMPKQAAEGTTGEVVGGPRAEHALPGFGAPSQSQSPDQLQPKQFFGEARSEPLRHLSHTHACIRVNDTIM